MTYSYPCGPKGHEIALVGILGLESPEVHEMSATLS